MSAPTAATGQQDSYTARLFAIREVRDYTQHIIGRTLTIIDAVIPPGPQNDAITRLIKNEIWDGHYSRVLEWAEREIRLGSDPRSAEQNAFPFATDRSVPGSTTSVSFSLPPNVVITTT